MTISTSLKPYSPKSDKTTIEVLSPTKGRIESLLVQVGDPVSKGSPIATISTIGAVAAAAES
ncbi:biotin/lipoyl-binding protein [Ensifer adhaerens]|uniref:biotin/lipoyl-containing protein n=1 Tax=Ensifer adhaerens TaxID=106592 RepID=UPI001CC19BC9|nr:biotin/lipoyl-binding protein [Ensifer adhaerens]UAX93912.1 biotin/lipoyl-binding protein [Ensifer adhaerens]UAY01547.1 biotin/lipoyl-binding protein [Ensifer adhaerens]UAY08930.1 biotin/lipoyl-binding protein [Ensifer adhaerens]